MPLDEQPTFTGKMSGEIWVFLTENKFRVQLSDGQLVDAIVPDDLIEEMRQYYVGPPLAQRIRVVVEFRPPPAMHRIVEIRGENWCGEGRAPNR